MRKTLLIIQLPKNFPTQALLQPFAMLFIGENMCLYISFGRNLNYWPSINLAAVQEPKEYAKEQDASIHRNGPVHGHGRDGGAWGPEGEENGNSAVRNSEDVDGDAEAAEAEGTPAHVG